SQMGNQVAHHLPKLMVSSTRQSSNFEIDSRELRARSSFQQNTIEHRRVTEPADQLSANKRGTNFREVLRSINFFPPQAFDENGVHEQTLPLLLYGRCRDRGA